MSETVDPTRSLAALIRSAAAFAAVAGAVGVGGCRGGGENKKAAPSAAERSNLPAEGTLLPVGTEAPDFESVA
jgi:nitrous oxide reductase